MNEVGDGAVEAKRCLCDCRKDDLPRALSPRLDVHSFCHWLPGSVREISFHSTFPSPPGVQRKPERRANDSQGALYADRGSEGEPRESE